MTDLGAYFFYPPGRAREILSLQSTVFSFAAGSTHGVPNGHAPGWLGSQMRAQIQRRGGAIDQWRSDKPIAVPRDCRRYVVVAPFTHHQANYVVHSPKVQLIPYDYLIAFINQADIHCAVYQATASPIPRPAFPFSITQTIQHSVAQPAIDFPAMQQVQTELSLVVGVLRHLDELTAVMVYGSIEAAERAYWQVVPFSSALQHPVDEDLDPHPLPLSVISFDFTSVVAAAFADALADAPAAASADANGQGGGQEDGQGQGRRQGRGGERARARGGGHAQGHGGDYGSGHGDGQEEDSDDALSSYSA